MYKRVLIVDDSATIRSVAESLLRQKGYDVLSLSDGHKAWELLVANPPDLIIWDSSLSSLDGLTLSQRLRSEVNLKNVPVVFLLNSAEISKKDRSKQSGAKEFMVKPFTPKDFLKTIQEIIGAPEPEEHKKEMPPSEFDVKSAERSIDEFFDSFEEPHEKPRSWALGEVPKIEQKRGFEEDIFSEATQKIPSRSSVEPLDPHQIDLPESEVSLPESQKSKVSDSSDEIHDYEWFINEMKQENQEKEKKTSQAGPAAEAEPEELPFEVPSGQALKTEEMGTSKIGIKKYIEELKKPVESEENEVSVYREVQITGEQPKLDRRSKTDKISTPQESQPTQKAPLSIDFESWADKLIEQISLKLSREIAKNIDKQQILDLLKQKVRDMEIS